MKKALTTLALGLGILIGSASANYRGHAASILTLSSFDNALITIEMNNRVIANPSQVVRMNGLRPGNHWIRVVKHQLNPHGYGTTNFIAYEGYIQIPARSRVTARLGGRNNLFIKRVVPLQVNRPVVNPNRGRYGRGSTAPRPRYGRGSTATPVCQPVVQPVQQPVFGMPPQVMENVLFSMQNTAFDNSRVSIARQAISAHGISSDQVLQLMQQLTFERSRLELAKFAYQFTVDPNNYFVVNNGFTFNSSIRELDRFIYG
ncbi:MAG: DUF4476 domain-containing protein [Salibacteraceae bacterium]